MKAVRNGLLATALAFSGCSPNEDTQPLPTLEDLKNEELPFEEARINGLFIDNNRFDSAKVTFQKDNYFIVFEFPDYFFYHEKERRSMLNWGEANYYDNNDGGEVDMVYMNGDLRRVDDSMIDSRYNILLIEMRRREVHGLWKERWRPEEE